MKVFIFLIILGFFLNCHIALAVDISGKWKVIDDKTGFVLVNVQINKLSDQTFEGKVTQAFVQRNIQSEENLDQIKGFQLLSGLKEDPKNINQFIGGKVKDPSNNMVYEVIGRLYKKGTLLIFRSNSDEKKQSRQLSWVKIK